MAIWFVLQLWFLPHERCFEYIFRRYGIDDFNQSLLGADVTYKNRRWQVWAEGPWAKFEIPNVESAWVTSNFVGLYRSSLYERYAGCLDHFE